LYINAEFTKIDEGNDRDWLFIILMVPKTNIIGSVCVSADEAKDMRGCWGLRVTFVFVAVDKVSSM
jgi:hypothetical protein